LLAAGWKDEDINKTLTVVFPELESKIIIADKPKALLFLIIKVLLLNRLIYALLAGSYDFFLNTISYSIVRILNILLINAVVYVIIVAVSFLLTIKIFNKKNSELIRNNIGKLILLIAVFQLMFGAISVFYGLRSVDLLDSYHTSFYVYAFLGSLLSCMFLYIIYSFFFLKKYVKLGLVIVSLIVIAYGANIAIYWVSVSRNYRSADIQEYFHLYPKSDIRNIVSLNKDKIGNSAQYLAVLISSLSNRELIKDSADESTQDYIQPTEDDLKILSQIADNGHVSFSEAFIPDDILLERDNMIIPMNKLRNFSRGIVRLADERILAGQFAEAENDLNNLLLLGDQLLRDDDDGLIIKLVGISIAKLSSSKLIELHKNEVELERYLTKLEEVKRSVSLITELGLNVSEGYYNTRDVALYFKYLDMCSDLAICHRPLIKHSFYSMDISLLLHGVGYMEFPDDIGVNISESLIGMVSGVLVKMNVGKNLVFYKKVVELSKKEQSQMLNFYLNNNNLAIIKRYGSEINQVSKIQDAVFKTSL